LPLLAALEGLREPGSLRIRRVTRGGGGHRLIHLTDLHYNGRRSWLERVVRIVNDENPDAVLVTGDFVDDSTWLPECLEILAGLRVPLFAVPGNHDYWCGASFSDLAACCAATGGRWLVDADHLHDGWLGLTGISEPALPRQWRDPFADQAVTRVLLGHYPAMVNSITGHRFDLILAGHSHGGQIRLPFFGALILPRHVDHYDLGWFDLPCGPLHVSAGIGTYFIPIRFCCRPDLTIITVSSCSWRIPIIGIIVAPY
jgi:predicted MPP superfamily phosphohydrolase